MLPLPTAGAPAAALASPAAAALCLRACTGLQYMSHLRILWKSLGCLSCRARYPSQIKPHYAGERGAHQQPSVQPCPHMYAPHPWALGLVAACSTLGCTCMPVTSGNQLQRYLRLPLHSPWTARADWPAMRCVGFAVPAPLLARPVSLLPTAPYATCIQASGPDISTLSPDMSPSRAPAGGRPLTLCLLLLAAAALCAAGPTDAGSRQACI